VADRLEEGEFHRHDRLLEQKERGTSRKLAGFEMIDRAIARQGYAVMSGGRQVGVVTSGTQTPFLKKAIGMAYVPTEAACRGHRDRHRRPRSCLESAHCALPFYSGQGSDPGSDPQELRWRTQVT
jgi:aminomethyltransferase